MSPPLAQETAIHATAVLLGATGVLLRGASGAGKSLMALDLIERSRACGLDAALIADDRVLLEARGGELIARPHPAIAGRIEVRGTGVGRIDHAAEGVIRLVADLLSEGEIAQDRCPEADARRALLCGLSVPRVALPAVAPSAAGAILAIIHQYVEF